MSLLRDRLLRLASVLSNYPEYVYPVFFAIGLIAFLLLPLQDICKAGHVYERALLADYVRNVPTLKDNCLSLFPIDIKLFY